MREAAPVYRWKRETIYTVLTSLWCPVASQDPSKGPELGIHPLGATSVGGLDSSSLAFHRLPNLYDTCLVFIRPRSTIIIFTNFKFFEPRISFISIFLHPIISSRPFSLDILNLRISNNLNK